MKIHTALKGLTGGAALFAFLSAGAPSAHALDLGTKALHAKPMKAGDEKKKKKKDDKENHCGAKKGEGHCGADKDKGGDKKE